MALATISAAFVSPVFLSARLFQFPYFGDRYFCELDWVDPSRSNYTIITNIFHFLLTLVIVCALYHAIYRRLKLR